MSMAPFFSPVFILLVFIVFSWVIILTYINFNSLHFQSSSFYTSDSFGFPTRARTYVYKNKEIKQGRNKYIVNNPYNEKIWEGESYFLDLQIENTYEKLFKY